MALTIGGVFFVGGMYVITQIENKIEKNLKRYEEKEAGKQKSKVSNKEQR